ncbi:MAG: ribonuclease J [Anaerolineae bacterium]|nr:ribonuclease J [Caldilineales bacterium]MDW8268843.1 ribonuclease J [Anaerolineae bacterium]
MSAHSTALRIIPLGGLGEFGKNMMAFEYGDVIIVVDAGLMFPADDMPGIDLVIPDTSYLLDNLPKVAAFILTHGHEDHIGALPYILPQIKAPIYGTRLTLGLVENKLREHRLLDAADLRVIDEAMQIQLGAFRLEFVHLCHSIPDVVGVVLHTPVGTVLHVTDYKFDAHPVDGRLTDEDKLRRLGDAGVRLLLSDSTNVEVAGYTPSEQELAKALDHLMGQAPGRVIVATFASNISRIQQVIDVAIRHGRLVGVTGRSMIQNVRMATELGYLRPPAGGLLTPEQMSHLPPERVAIVCTGTQGEPTSALVRMSQGQYRHLRIGQGDTVIISASPIPGNEKMIHRTLDNLFRLGADIYYDELTEVHVSGHGSREDQKHLLRLVRPEYLIPIHGEYRQLVLHARLAREVGIPAENVFVIENGQVMTLDGEGLRPAELVNAGDIFVDGLGDVASAVLRDRRHLGRDGFLVVVIGLDKTTGEVLLGPEILSRGFVHMAEAGDLVTSAKELVWKILEQEETAQEIADRAHTALVDFCQRTTGRRPMVIPLVVEM